MFSPTHTFYPTAHASTKTISLVGNLVGYYYYWNSTNPTIAVTQGDSITLALSSSDGAPHRFLLDFDGDGVSDTTDCPSTDPCSSSFTTIATISFTANTVGTYMYYCTIHYPYMAGHFNIQAAPAPGFSIEANPTSLSFQQGSSGTSIIALTSLNGFSGSLALSGSASPLGPTVSFSSASVTLSSGGTATSGSLSRSATVQVTVGSSDSSPSGALNLPLTLLVGVAVVIMAVVAVTVLLVRRKTAK